MKGTQEERKSPPSVRGGDEVTRRNVDTVGDPDVIIVRPILGPAGGHCPLMLGFILWADQNVFNAYTSRHVRRAVEELTRMGNSLADEEIPIT